MSTPRKTKLPWWIAAGVTILCLVSAVVSGVSSQDGFLQYLIDIAPLVVFLWIAAWMATRLASWVELKDWPTVVAYTLPSIVIVFFPYWSPVRYREITHLSQIFWNSKEYYLFLAGAVCLPLGIIGFMRRRNRDTAGAIVFGLLLIALNAPRHYFDILHP